MAAPADDLRAAEDDLQRIRGLLALVTAWLHNPAYDHTARHALAQSLGIPGPAPERTP